jgi:hypothetical protein
MSLDTDLEEIRVMSLLSDLPHENINHDQRYVAYSGYVLTYSTFSTIMLWAIAGSKIYHSIWQDRPDAVQEVRDLNPQDARLAGLHDDNVGEYIRNQFRSRMKSMTDDAVESLLSSMFYDMMESQIH